MITGKNMKKALLFLFITVSGCLFGQEEKVFFTGKALKSGNWCSISYLPSLHVGDTLVISKKEGKRCTNAMRFGISNSIFVKHFGRTYDGKAFLEYKEKGKWQLVENTGQLLILDFTKTKIEFQLISNKKDHLKFVVINMFVK